MGHRTKCIIVIILVLGSLVAFFANTTRGLFLKSFSDLETRTMLTEVERARESINYELELIDTLTSDYSGWDEAYQFVQRGGRSFIRSNLADAVFTKLKLNMIAYFNEAGRMVYGRMYDYRSGVERSIPPDIMAHFALGAPLLTQAMSESGIKGFITTSDGILMTSSRPVLTSNFTGPPRGTLVMARLLDEATLRAVAERTRRQLSVLPLTRLDNRTDEANISHLLSGNNFIHVAANNDTVYGYNLFSDLYGKKAFILKVSATRSIFKQGENTVSNAFYMFIYVTILFAGSLYVAFDRLTATLRKQHESEMRYHTLVDRAAEGIVLVTVEGHFILDANAAFAKLTGVPLQEMWGCSLLDYFEGPREELKEEFSRIMHETRELQVRNYTGDTVFVEVNASSISHEGKTVLSLIVHNITDRKTFEDQLLHQANHDPLTGMPNRTLFNDRLKHALALAQRKKSRTVLMLIDLDHFKVINDTLGHSYGDALLCAAAKRLEELIRASDTIARIGGDEFVAVLTNIPRKDDVITVAQRYLDQLSKPFMVLDQEINLTASIGIAQFPEDGDDPETLFKKADTAMYHIKERGRNGIQFYADEMNLKASKRMMLESRLRHAIEQNELYLHYQPQIDLTSGRIVGMEVLLRWSNRELGVIAPADFIPVAEETGLIVPLGKWALHAACLQYREWINMGLPKLRMAVNLSPRQFVQKDLVEMVRDILEKTAFDPTRLDLEVTESLMMNNIEDSIEKMLALKQLGVSLSIDDFGTGYSSLNSLQRFPLDILKIDRSFVTMIGTGKSVIIRAIVAMAHSLSMKVVAEGVENLEQLNFLRNHRCEEVQGFYFSRPLPADEFFALIASMTDFQEQIDMIGKTGTACASETQPVQAVADTY